MYVFFENDTTSSVATQGVVKRAELMDINEPENEDEILMGSDDEEKEEYESISEDESQKRAEPIGDISQHQEDSDQTQSSRRLRGRRSIKPPERYMDYVWENINELLVTDSNEPQSYQEALESVETERWRAMQEEMDSL